MTQFKAKKSDVNNIYNQFYNMNKKIFNNDHNKN